MSEPQDLSSRLRDITGEVSKKETRGRLGIVLFAGTALLATAGGAAYLATLTPKPAPTEAAIPVVETEEFPTDTGGFGGLDLPPRPADPTPIGSMDTAQQEMLSALQAELDALKSAQEQGRLRNERDREAALAALQNKMQSEVDKLSEAAEAAREELERRERTYQAELDRKATELERLQAEFDLQRGVDAQLHSAEMERLRTELELERQRVENSPELDPFLLAEREAEEQQRRRLEELRAKHEAERERRVHSKMLAFGSNGTGGATEAGSRELSANEAFVKRQIEAVPVASAQVIARPESTIVQGTILQAVLETAIDTSLPGAIRAIVAEDVHSMDGSNIVVPRGSKIFGEYSSEISIAQRRAVVVWTRIVTPDGKSVQITSFGGDTLGRAGTTGHVDTRFAARFGSAALISFISALPTVAGAQTENDVTADVLMDVGDDLRNSTRSVIGDYLRIPPTIRIDQGSEISVILDRDVEIY